MFSKKLSSSKFLILVTLLVTLILNQIIMNDAARYPVKKLQKQKQQLAEDETVDESSTEIGCSILNDPNCKDKMKKGSNTRGRQEQVSTSTHSTSEEFTLPGRYKPALTFAQYLVMELFRELGGVFGWKRHGWEMTVLERVFKNVSSELLLFLHLMLK